MFDLVRAPPVDVYETLAVMRKLWMDLYIRVARFDPADFQFRMHPETFHDVELAIDATYPAWRVLGLRQLEVDGVRVVPDMLMPAGEVSIVAVLGKGKVARVPQPTDEAKE